MSHVTCCPASRLLAIIFGKLRSIMCDNDYGVPCYTAYGIYLSQKLDRRAVATIGVGGGGDQLALPHHPPSEQGFSSWLMPTYLCSVNLLIFYCQTAPQSSQKLWYQASNALWIHWVPRYQAGCGRGQWWGLKFSRTSHNSYNCPPPLNNIS